MTWRGFALGSLLTIVGAAPRVALAADYHHVHLAAPNGEEAAQWYIKHMGCQATPMRKDAAQCGSVVLLFAARAPKGGSEGSGVNHIGFSFKDLAAKMKEYEAAGVKIAGPVRDAPGLFKLAFVEDPWGTRIEVVEDFEYLGFHHIHLRSTDPEATLKWYQNAFGGQVAKLKGRLDGVLYGTVWLLAGRVGNTHWSARDELVGFMAARDEVRLKQTDFYQDLSIATREVK